MKQRHFLLVCIGVLAFGLVWAKADGDNTFESSEAGFKLTKPAEWQFLPAHTVAQNLALPRMRDKELEKVIRSRPSIPFLVVARFPEPYEGLNPSVQVSLKTQGELLGQGASALLQHVVERLKGTFSDFAFVEEVTETTVDSLPAARMIAKYTVIDSQGKDLKALARMWIVPRGDYMLTISMYGPQDGPNTSQKEFQQIFQSIKLTKQR